MRCLFFCALFLAGGLLAGCHPEELPVPAHDAGDVLTASVSMEGDYRYQVFYSLRANRVVSQSPKTAWDLGFSSAPEGWAVVLNSSKIMFALRSNATDLSAVSLADTAGYAAGRKWDAPSGALDSTALGDWRAERKPVYLLDRGYDGAGKQQGWAAIQIRAVDAGGYTLAYKLLTGTGAAVQELRIAKDTACSFSYFSLGEGATVRVEPPKIAWDVVFTQYTHTFYEPAYQPYLVTGCLTNRAGMQAAVADSSLDFTALNYEQARAAAYSPAINVIGYDWKTFTGSAYITNPRKAYFLRDAQGVYYKLHFVDFLSGAGVKGNPKWEFQRL